MYVCMYVRLYVCMYVCTYVCTFVCTYVFPHFFMFYILSHTRAYESHEQNNNIYHCYKVNLSHLTPFTRVKAMIKLSDLRSKQCMVFSNQMLDDHVADDTEKPCTYVHVYLCNQSHEHMQPRSWPRWRDCRSTSSLTAMSCAMPLPTLSRPSGRSSRPSRTRMTGWPRSRSSLVPSQINNVLFAFFKTHFFNTAVGHWFLCTTNPSTNEGVRA